MGRMELPPADNKDLAQLLDDAKARLPLSGCTTERNNLLCNYESFGEIEYVAPHGKGFRITGQFTVWGESDDVTYSHSSPPDVSRELYEANIRDKLQRMAKVSGRSYEDLLEESIENAREDLGYTQTLPSEFMGKRLALRIDDKELLVCIKGPVHADAEGALAKYDIPFNADNPATDTYVVPVPLRFWHWERSIALARVADCQVELVDYDEPAPELYIPRHHEDEVGLWTPDQSLDALYALKNEALRRRGVITTDKMPDKLPPSLLSTSKDTSEPDLEF